MSKLNESTKALNEQTSEIMKKLKADQVLTSELIQRLRRIENSANAPEKAPMQSATRTERPAARESTQRTGGNQQRTTRRDGDSRGGAQTGSTRRPQQQTTGGRGPNINKQMTSTILPPQEKERVSNYDPKKNSYSQRNENEKRAKNKKQLTKQNAATYDDDRFRTRKKKKQEAKKIEPIVITEAVINTEMVSVKDLSEKLGKPSASIIKQLLVLGIFATINQEIDFDTAQLIADEFGIKLTYVPHKTVEDELLEEVKEDDEADLIKRPPVVTIMGHVDHGKTSLLDAIRTTKVTKGEAGGITQHIGAYSIERNGKKITFLDTPGHEAFTSMRARGASVTDVAILVVAADDGIKPQTIEAISHAKAAEVPIIVAINKIDKPEANVEKVKQELTEYELVPEEWGGDTVIAPVSAQTKEGLDDLLEMILLVSDVQELKANPKRNAKGAIVEARLDKGRGPVATVLVQNGTLHVGDTIVAGTSYGHVRAMIDDDGANVEEAGPSMPVAVLGFGDVPQAGDIFYVVEDDKLSRQVAEERKDKMKIEQVKKMSAVSLDDLFDQISEGEMKVLNLIVKADVQGSAEALKQSLEKLTNDEVKINVIHSAVGAITKADVMLASASNAIIIGFNIVPDPIARSLAEKDNIDIRTYRVIYNVIEDIEKALIGMLDPEFREVVIGHVEVRQIFKVSNVGTIAGAYVLDGKVTRNARVRLTRDGAIIHDGEISSLKRFKENAKEVAAGFECGIQIEGYDDLKVGDVIEAIIDEEVVRS